MTVKQTENHSLPGAPSPADEASADAGQCRMSLGEHLEELRGRLIRALLGLAAGMAVCLVFGRQLVGLLVHPYVRVTRQLNMQADLSVLTVGAGIDVYLRVCLYAGVLLACPWIFYQLWLFIAQGLYERERRYIRLAVPLSALLFLAGAAFFLFVASIPAMRFLLAFNNWLGLRAVINFQDYVGFMTNLMLIFGLAFQTPLLVLLMAKMGVVSVAALNHYRRHVVVGILILAALVTPSPSPVDQLALGVPMWLLYELGVLLAYVSTRRTTPLPYGPARRGRG